MQTEGVVGLFLLACQVVGLFRRPAQRPCFFLNLLGKRHSEKQLVRTVRVQDDSSMESGWRRVAHEDVPKKELAYLTSSLFTTRC